MPYLAAVCAAGYSNPIAAGGGGVKKIQMHWQFVLGGGLVVLSALVYVVHYLIFGDLHHIFIYLLGDIGFVFIEVLLVTLVLHRLLAFREKQVLLKKLNMVVGVFFSEVGSPLLRRLGAFGQLPDDESCAFRGAASWQSADFRSMRRRARTCSLRLDPAGEDLDGLRSFLHEKRPFLIALLENPNVFEHEEFTDLLWAVFHLTEELENRPDCRALPQPDQDHLRIDIIRAYRLLLSLWVAYLEHLKKDYPYLFSFAIRLNPFAEEANAVISA